MKLSLKHTITALEIFDREAPLRDAMLARATTHEGVAEWQKVEALALFYVRSAFYVDTCDRNTRANCMLVDIKWIRDLVAQQQGDSHERRM